MNTDASFSTKNDVFFSLSSMLIKLGEKTGICVSLQKMAFACFYESNRKHFSVLELLMKFSCCCTKVIFSPAFSPNFNHFILFHIRHHGWRKSHFTVAETLIVCTDIYMQLSFSMRNSFHEKCDTNFSDILSALKILGNIHALRFMFQFKA